MLKLNYRSPKLYNESGVYLRLVTVPDGSDKYENKQYRLINLNWLRSFI